MKLYKTRFSYSPSSTFHLAFYRILCVSIFIFQLQIFAQEESASVRYIDKKLIVIDSLIEIGQYDRALSTISNLENTFSFRNSEVKKYEVDFRYAQVLYLSNKEEKAVELCLRNIEKLSNYNNEKIYIDYLNFLTKVFANSDNIDKAIQFNKIVLNIPLVKRDTIGFLIALNRMGSFYYKKSNLDSAKYYFKRVIYYPVNTNTENRISNAFNNLGVIAQVEDNYDLAKGYAREALEIKEKVNDTVGVAMLTANLANLYHFQGDFKEAIKNYDVAITTLRNDTTYETELIRRTIYDNLAIAYDSLGNFDEAYNYLRRSYVLNDKINNSNLSETLAEVEAKYNVERQEHETEIEKNKALRARILFYGLAFLTLISIILGIIFYKNYKLKQQNKIDQLQYETQSRVINATIDAKEKERRKIAEILHDSVSALLSSANLHLQASKPHMKGTVPVEITKAQGIIDEAAVKIRDLSHQLISSVLMKFGLAYAVHDLCQKYSNSELEFISDDHGIKRYNQKFEIKIYNIIEELVNNIIKHSEAKNASISLSERNGNTLVIQIIDDGEGFDLKKARTKDGLGLSHIEARLKYMNGVFNINTKKGEGTSIFISVPIFAKSTSDSFT
ncbi:tetratricopeptide repeat-containing sensor histidine kinase [Namhaeicola litoreus]|uniref:histidine kinase n=1 Tax=Namhaeicola litoreus TaxID=1052145 RepID=A0ABW3Y535_9FLAO